MRLIISVSRQRSSASCSRALEAVRSVRERLLGGNTAIEEQRANFAPYGSSSSTRRGTNRTISKQWSIKMFCLADRNCVRVPCTPSSREVLIEAGLGPKTFSVPLNSSGEEFREMILSHFPKLRDGGGFDLLRCIPNSKHLDVISPSVAQSARLLKAAVGNGRVYVRPIQKNLDLSVDEEAVPQCEVNDLKCNIETTYVNYY